MAAVSLLQTSRQRLTHSQTHESYTAKDRHRTSTRSPSCEVNTEKMLNERDVRKLHCCRLALVPDEADDDDNERLWLLRGVQTH